MNKYADTKEQIHVKQILDPTTKLDITNLKRSI